VDGRSTHRSELGIRLVLETGRQNVYYALQQLGTSKTELARKKELFESVAQPWFDLERLYVQ